MGAPANIVLRTAAKGFPLPLFASTWLLALIWENSTLA
jgi:hypothetical protein